MSKTSVLVIEDHPATAQGLQDLLRSYADLSLVATVLDGEQGLQLAESYQPAVVLLDLALPDQPGAAVARQLQTLNPPPQCLIYSAYDDPAHVHAALAAGVAGYVLKTDSLFTVVEAIRAVVQGEPWYSQRVRGEALAWLRGEIPAPPEVAMLTAREIEVLRHVAQGASNREIAVTLDISVHTVMHHVSHLLEKLGCQNRVEVALRAAKEGWEAWI